MRGGAKISPLELDCLLAQHPAVAAALTVGVPDPLMGERIHALAVLHSGAGIDEADYVFRSPAGSTGSSSRIPITSDRNCRPGVPARSTAEPCGRQSVMSARSDLSG